MFSHDINKFGRAGQISGDYSLEVGAREFSNFSTWAQALAPGTRIFLPHFARTDLSLRLAQGTRLRRQGLTPVAHLAARRLPRGPDLDDIIAQHLAAGIDEFLLLAGDGPTRPNKLNNALDLLATEILSNPGIKALGVAGHPEDHPQQPQRIMRAALRDKLSVITAQGIPGFIVTQFCFTAAPYLEFLDWLQSEGINCPVILGIPGAVRGTKLFQFAAGVGWGSSFNFACTHFSRAWGLFNFSAAKILGELLTQVPTRNYSFPVHIHFFPFGALTETIALTYEAKNFPTKRSPKI